MICHIYHNQKHKLGSGMKILGLVLALMASSFVYSSDIIIGKSIELLAVDGVKNKTSFFGSDKIEVEDGSHQLVVKYKHKFRNGDTLESDPYIFNIEVGGNTELNTDKYSTYALAKEQLKTDISWHVKNQNRQYTINNTDKLKGEGFMPFRNIELLVQEYNQLNNIASTEPVNQDILNNKNAKNYLIEQYKAANQEQKNQFKLWFIQH